MTDRDSVIRAHRRSRLASALLIATLASSGPLLGSGEPVPLNAVNVPPGATVTVTFEVDVDNPLGICASAISNQGTVTGANFSNVPTDDPDAAGSANPTATTLDAVALAITKTDGAASEVPGTGVTYTITVTNSGPQSAIGANVSDTFPAALTGVSWTCAASAGSSCTAGPTAGNINDTVNILSGGTLTYTVNATITASASGTLVNTATVTKPSGQIECNLADNSATDTDTLTPQVDLAITKTDGLTTINAGSPTTYTITVTNTGPSDAIGATVADTFPATLTSPTWTCVASALSSCTAGPVAGNISDVVTVRAGGTLTYTVNATVSGTAPAGTLSNTATVTAPGGTTDTNGGNNSATDTTTVVPVADLAITKDDGVTTAVPGMTVTYTIVASNAGPATATGASVADTFPAPLTCTWTCVGAGGGTCAAGPVAGNIADSANLPAGATATYTAICTLSNAATGSLANTATISGGGVTDPTPGNNSATDTDTILALDFGDAPDGSLAAPSGYPTLLPDNGARHGIAGPHLGVVPDAETNGQPTLNADGDDLTGTDDEDGVVFTNSLITCETANLTVTASAISKLDAFVDFDADGNFTDPGEKVVNNLALVVGPNAVSFTVPCTASVVPKTFARFRVSSVGGLAADGVAADGEVEDYAQPILGVDYGDAPDPSYPTLFASNGPRHIVTGPLLGALRDADANGQPSAGALGDDLAGVDDEDGVTFTSPLIVGQTATVTVTASAAGVLNAWLDFNADGNFSTAGDQIFTNQALAAGPNLLTFSVPVTASSNLTTVSRWRVATAGGLSFTGLAQDGEVEDHAVSTAAVADLAITKTDGSSSETPGTPVTYTIVGSNTGPDPVTGAAVADTFPAILSGCSWTCVGAGGGTCTAAGPGNISDTVNLPVGASVTYTATCSIDPAATGTLANTATIAVPATAFDPSAANNSATDTDTLTAEADVAVTKTDGATDEVPGTPVTYTIALSNGGPSTATGVSLTDTFPATLTGCSWTSIAAGGATGNTAGPVSGNIAESGMTMPPFSSITYTATCTVAPAATGTLVNTATASAATTDPTPGNNSATDTDNLTPQADVSVTKTDGATDEVPGTPVTYTIVLASAGPSTATAVTLADTFPAALTGCSWTSVAAGGATGNTAGPVSGNINESGMTLPPSSSVTYSATCTVAPAARGTLANTATTTTAVTDPTPGNNSATDTDNLTPQVDIVVTKIESIDPVVAGSGTGNLTYTVTVLNNGPSQANGVTLSEVVTNPAGVTVDSTTPSAPTTFTPPTTWTVGTLNPAGSATLTVVLTATSAAAPGTNTICDTATLTAVTEPQVVTGNETATECTSVTVSADLEITKDDDADPPGAGDPLVYTITVTNHGPSNAAAVQVTDTLPAAVTYVSDTCSASNVPPWTWNIGALANGATVSCDITVSINPTPPASITNTATVTSPTNDAVPGNNSDDEDTTLDAVPPHVTNVNSVADTGDGTIDDCETANDLTITALEVTFDETMNDPAGDSDPDDVTNPANYRVVTPGGDFDFQTTSCASTAGDLVLPIASVTYDSFTDTATVTLAAALPATQVRLFACDPLTDAAGNQLDGDGDTTAGGDFVRAFRADPKNLFANGHFDCTLDDWTVVAPAPGEVTWTGTTDADGANASGAVHVTNLAPGVDTNFSLWQCLDVPPVSAFGVSARVRMDAAPGDLIGFSRSCRFFSGAGCSGSLGSPSSSTVLLQDTGGVYVGITGQVTRPAGAVSARCDFTFATPTALSFNAYLDAVQFSSTLLFGDGFESGDTSAWSATFP